MTIDNHYVRLYKSEVEKFLKKAREISAEKQRNISRYQPAVASVENAKLSTQLSEECLKTKNNINNIYETVRTYLSIASFPSKEMPSDYLLYFNGSVKRELSEEFLQILVDECNKYMNFDMLDVISTYIDDYNSGKPIEEQRFLEVKNSIRSPKDLLQVYQQFARGAVSLCDRICEAPDKFGDWQLEAYAEQSYTQNSFNIIGDGVGLSTFADRKVPEAAKHLYDSKIVPLEDAIQTGFEAYSHIHQ